MEPMELASPNLRWFIRRAGSFKLRIFLFVRHCSHTMTDIYKSIGYFLLVNQDGALLAPTAGSCRSGCYDAHDAENPYMPFGSSPPISNDERMLVHIWVVQIWWRWWRRSRARSRSFSTMQNANGAPK